MTDRVFSEVLPKQISNFDLGHPVEVGSFGALRDPPLLEEHNDVMSGFQETTKDDNLRQKPSLMKMKTKPPLLTRIHHRVQKRPRGDYL